MTNQEINEAVARKIHVKDLRIEFHDDGIIETVCFKDGKSWTLPNYCQSISAAWEIVEHLAMTTYIQRPAVGGKEWHVSFGEQGWSEADTAPMAICLGFLKLDQRCSNG